VAPGPEARNPLPAAGLKPTHLIWTGFQKSGSSGRVFLQTNAPVTYDLVPAKDGRGRAVSVMLRNCRIHMRNNARRIDARFFGTAVEEIVAHQRRKDVELRITVKPGAIPAPRTEPGPQGTQFLVLDFGEAGAPTPSSPQAQRTTTEAATDKK
jgi:hypothetical protein